MINTVALQLLFHFFCSPFWKNSCKCSLYLLAPFIFLLSFLSSLWSGFFLHYSIATSLVKIAISLYFAKSASQFSDFILLILSVTLTQLLLPSILKCLLQLPGHHTCPFSKSTLLPRVCIQSCGFNTT